MAYIYDKNGMVIIGPGQTVNPNSMSNQGKIMAEAYAAKQNGQNVSVPVDQIKNVNKAGTLGSYVAPAPVAPQVMSPQNISAPTPSITGGLGGATSTNTGSTSPTNLVSFKDTLASVMDLAQQKRNTNMQAFMGTPGFQGTLQASDFNQLFSQMNAQGDKKIKDVVDTAFKDQPTWKTDQIGSDLYQYQVGGDGRIIGDPIKVMSGKNKEDEQKQIQIQLSQAFSDPDTQRDGDGFPLPAEYRDAKAFWVSKGLPADEFDKIFSNYVNPKKAQDYGVNFQTKISSNDTSIENPFK